MRCVYVLLMPYMYTYRVRIHDIYMHAYRMSFVLCSWYRLMLTCIYAYVSCMRYTYMRTIDGCTMYMWVLRIYIYIYIYI